ncbi:hypothetical protein [Actinacidiphila oryziradicis]|uniref:hypothetical protein n=1 Tax=Actinacidiphila oryziradicis TaxID=2571141 RepID=UPI0023F01F22|nr:hypothetical protein [Actinacidiphila oryziradicis]
MRTPRKAPAGVLTIDVDPGEAGGVHPGETQLLRRLGPAPPPRQQERKTVAAFGDLSIAQGIPGGEPLGTGDGSLCPGLGDDLGDRGFGDVPDGGDPRKGLQPGSRQGLVGGALREGEHLLVRAVPLLAQVLQGLGMAPE